MTLAHGYFTNEVLCMHMFGEAAPGWAQGVGWWSYVFDDIAIVEM